MGTATLILGCRGLEQSLEIAWLTPDSCTLSISDGGLAIVIAFTGRLLIAVLIVSVQGTSVSVEASGKDALRQGMASYFRSIPSARSTIEDSMISGRYVVVRERASWKDKNGEERSQAAVAVYEVRDGLVARVWYYPAE